MARWRITLQDEVAARAEAAKSLLCSHLGLHAVTRSQVVGYALSRLCDELESAEGEGGHQEPTKWPIAAQTVRAYTRAPARSGQQVTTKRPPKDHQKTTKRPIAAQTVRARAQSQDLQSKIRSGDRVSVGIRSGSPRCGDVDTALASQQHPDPDNNSCGTGGGGPVIPAEDMSRYRRPHMLAEYLSMTHTDESEILLQDELGILREYDADIVDEAIQKTLVKGRDGFRGNPASYCHRICANLQHDRDTAQAAEAQRAARKRPGAAVAEIEAREQADRERRRAEQAERRRRLAAVWRRLDSDTQADIQARAEAETAPVRAMVPEVAGEQAIRAAVMRIVEQEHGEGSEAARDGAERGG